MKPFSKFILENKELPWSARQFKTHWVGDDEDGSHVYLYHGSHRRNTENIEKHGATKPDPTTGKVSFAFEPHTAKGYSAMSGSGGESEFRKAGASAVNVPQKDRGVHVWKVPKHIVRSALEKTKGLGHGNLEGDQWRLADKARHKKEMDDHLNKGGLHPYTKSEVRLDPETAKDMHKYYVGHMYPKG